MIDRTGYQIIETLKKDGRHSYARLARELGVNVATVAKRIDAMLAEDIIAFKAVPNPYKMGYQAHAFITLSVDMARVDDVCSRLVNNLNVSLVVTSFGRYDILLIADFYSLEELQAFSKNELPQIDGVKQINTFLISEIKKRYDGIFQSEPGAAAPVIDAVDQRLIEELQKDGRASYKELADMTGISLATVSRRVNHLIRENIIKINAIPNPSRLGYASDVFVALDAEPTKIDSICTALANHPEVHLVMTVMTGFDILIGAHLSTPEMLYNLIKEEIATIDGVSIMETFVRAEIKKRYYGAIPPLPMP